MGIKEKIKNLGSFQPESKDELNQPMTGGNNFSIQKEWSAKVANIFSNGFSTKRGRNTNDIVYDEYFLMLFQKNYFVNLFDIETEDKDFKKCGNIFVELCFGYGDAAIVNLGIKGLEDTTSLIPVYIKSKSITPLGDIDKKFEYYIGAHILPMMADDVKFRDRKANWGMKSEVNKDEDFIYGKGNSQGYGAGVGMYKFIKFQRDLMKMTHNTTYLQRDILFMNVNNVNSANNDAEQIYNPDANVIYQLGVDGEGTGKMENRGMVDAPSKESNMTINQVYDGHIQKYYELFGRRNNIDFKKERNITSEVDASQEQFDIITNETFKYMEIALKECKEKFGKEGSFKFYGDNKREDFGDNSFGKEEDSSISKQDKGLNQEH